MAPQCSVLTPPLMRRKEGREKTGWGMRSVCRNVCVGSRGKARAHLPFTVEMRKLLILLVKGLDVN